MYVLARLVRRAPREKHWTDLRNVVINALLQITFEVLSKSSELWLSDALLMHLQSTPDAC